MLGLDAYDSSSEDEVQTKQPQKVGVNLFVINYCLYLDS